MSRIPGLNGTSAADSLGKIHDALNVVHSPYSSNQDRQDAQKFLEAVKALDEAPSHGFSLACDPSQPPIVRHYALSLLEHAVKHKWADYSQEQAQYLRQWVLQLADGVSKDDPVYVRTKTAQLWVELAKRCWAAEWMDMDELLVQLWRSPGVSVHKEFVLQVLEMLSDEIFNNSADDSIVALREGMLSKACVEIFTSASVLVEAFPNRQAGPNVRFEEEGWLNRVSVLLRDCLGGDIQDNGVKGCALKSLGVLYSLVQWILPKAVVATGCVPVAFAALAAPQLSTQKAALEVLHALYSRTSFSDDEFVALVVPAYNDDVVDLCRRLFQWSAVDAGDIDDDKYQFGKKLSEMISCVGNYLDRKFSALPAGLNIQGFLDLALEVVQSPSLVVSIPVLVTWTRLLSHRALGPAAANTPLIGPLLELCSARLIRYESFPDTSEDPTYLLLIEDTDTMPERHAFLGNYRRYASQVIESVVQLKLSEALSHILSQAENVVRNLYGSHQVVDPSKYSRDSEPILKVDAHFTVVESALKGFVKWRSSPNCSDDDPSGSTLEAEFEAWCLRLLELKIEDPVIRKRVLQLLVAFSTMALDKNAGFMLKVLEHILMTWPALQPEHKVLNDAIKELQTESMVELHRLATKMPDHLLDVYDQLDAKVHEMIAYGALDEKRQLAYQSFLFIIIHRATRIDEPSRVQRLRRFVEPVKALWTDQSLTEALVSYDNFCQLTALDKAQAYLTNRRIHELGDWGSVDLDGEGLALQAELEQRQGILPLRSTKSFLTYSAEKIEKGSAPYQASCELWQDGFPIILPRLLSFMSYAHASHNPKNWTSLPPEMRSIVGRVLTDRFWQAGISEGSKDDFYARVLDKKNTLEGLASSIRGSVRFVRETCYAIIYCMSRLDHQFYGFSELPGPLANALFADSSYLSTHQIINLLNLVRYLVDHCPVELRGHFLPPILAVCFQQMDNKIGKEWEVLGVQGGVRAAGDELTEEMKAESILRQLTYTAVVMVADFLDPSRADLNAESEKAKEASRHPSLRRFCLMQASVVGPLLIFCKNAIRMHDGRCCGVVLRIFRSIVPEFQCQPNETFPIPEDTAHEICEFISSDVLRAAIESLHDPYFVDSQRDLGALIASILAHYSTMTPTPRKILLSVNDIKSEDVDQAINDLTRSSLPTRQQRAIVLDLLKDLKGVSISEQGRLSKSAASVKADRSSKRALRSKMAQEFMNPNSGSRTDGDDAGADSGTRKTPDLDGVATMFNEQ